MFGKSNQIDHPLKSPNLGGIDMYKPSTVMVVAHNIWFTSGPGGERDMQPHLEETSGAPGSKVPTGNENSMVLTRKT